MNSPTRRFEDVEKLVNEGSKQLDNIDSVKEGNDRDKWISSKGGGK